MALQESTYNAALQNTPMNTYDMRSVGSTYATDYAGVSTTLLLAPDIRPDIIPAFPKQFTDMAFFMSLKKRAVRSLEYNWFEMPWIHVPLGVRTNTGATAAVAGTVVTQTIPVTTTAIRYVRQGDKGDLPRWHQRCCVGCDRIGHPEHRGELVAGRRPSSRYHRRHPA
jgi:hypothetical protein